MLYIHSIFKNVWCFQCASYNRAFNTLNRIYKTPLRTSKCLNKKYISNKSIFELNTNVTKNVLLYKSSSDRIYKIISIFAVVQFGFWLTVADSYYALLNKNVNDGNENRTVWWIDKLKTKGKIVTIGIPVGCVCMGTVLIAICAVYTTKSVKMLVLCKGGENLSIISFGLFNKNIVKTIPLDKVSCSVGRNTSNHVIPLKVKGNWFSYILDKKGTIHNPQLFDMTAGLKRNI